MPDHFRRIRDQGTAFVFLRFGKSKGILSAENIPCLRFDLKTIFFSRTHIRNEDFIDSAGIHFPHLVDSSVKMIKGTDHADSCNKGRPDGKGTSLYAVSFLRMCSQFFINGIMNSARKFNTIFSLNPRLKGVGIRNRFLCAVLIGNLIKIGVRIFLIGKQCCKKTGLIRKFHFIAPALCTLTKQNLYFFRFR